MSDSVAVGSLRPPRMASYSLEVLLSPDGALRFNRNLIRQRGIAMGEEFRGKGIHVQVDFSGGIDCQFKINLTWFVTTSLDHSSI